jgi:hypothetical protein
MNPVRILAVALSLFGAALVCLAADHRIETVKKFEAARERGDLETASALLAPDPRVWFDTEERKGPGEPWSLEKGEWDHWDHFFHRKIAYSDWKSQGDHVTATGRETNDYYRLLDWEPKPLALTWWFDSSGKITGFMFHAVRDAPTHSRLREFETWAKKNHPGEIAYLKPKGRMNPTKDRPERWLALLKEWRKAAGLPEVRLSGAPAEAPSK